MLDNPVKSCHSIGLLISIAGLTLENWQLAHFRILGNDKYVPLEQDSIDVVESLGGEYQGIYKMLMTRMVGIDASNVKNSVMIKSHPLSRGGDYFKFEPILIFYKPKE